MDNKTMKTIIGLLTILAAVYIHHADGARIKDVVDIQGVRSNPLQGMGLVVGLNGTGDSVEPPKQVLSSLLGREGITFNPSSLASGSIALVAVTAELGPWDRVGSRIDINVSTVGDAKSLQGGILLATELRGLDGQVYAVASVPSISTASWTVESSKTGSKAAKNHPTVGRIPNGAHVERQEIGSFWENIGGSRFITMVLRNSDFGTAERIRQAIETAYPDTAYVQDAGTIRVKVPETVSQRNMVRFVDEITSYDVDVDIPAVVIINERTGTIVVGGNVAISETAIAQGSLVVKVKEQQYVSQPTTPFTEGATTAVVDDTAISVEEEEGHLIPVPNVVTVEQLANALNAIGATPRDLIAIFNALKAAGALQAKLQIM
jgi:flagellar P-ring protein precursor FlgI